ncbi:MAG: hypothetical protein ACRCXT_12310 [Paraclostridium sp.]
MSRIEKLNETKIKRRKHNIFFRIIFILMLICCMSVCVFIIDKHATLMFGNVEKYNIEVFLSNIEQSVKLSIEDAYEKLSKLNNIKLD